MAEVYGLLYDQLTTHAGLSALIGTSAYPVKLPQKPDIPAIVYRKISDGGFVGDTALHRDRYQFTLYASKYVAVNDLATQLQDAMENHVRTDSQPGILQTWKLNHVDFYDDETDLFGIVADYFLIICD